MALSIRVGFNLKYALNGMERCFFSDLCFLVLLFSFFFPDANVMDDRIEQQIFIVFVFN